MTEYETAMIALRNTGNWIALGVGVVQAGLIGGGLWLMRTAAGARNTQHTDLMDILRQQAETAKAHHTENMEALRQQGEAARATHALRALIERTAPAGGAKP